MKNVSQISYLRSWGTFDYTDDFVKTYNADSDDEYILEVAFKCPKHLKFQI